MTGSASDEALTSGTGAQLPPPDPRGDTPRDTRDDMHGGPAGGGPGLREVLRIAVAVVLGVFALMILTALVPPVREALAALPIAVVFLVVVTAGVLVLVARTRPRA